MGVAEILAIVGGLAAGVVGKKIGKSEDVGGSLPVQKVAAPLAAVLGSVATSAAVMPAMPVETLLASGKWGLVAVVIHTILKNLVQLVQEYRKLKEAENG